MASVVLITGANSGAAKAEIERAHPASNSHLSAIHFDVTDSSSIRDASDRVSQRFGHLDVLVNNAAVGGTHEPDIRERFENLMNTNVIGPAVMAEIFRSLLLKAPGTPYSILVSSGAGSCARAISRPKPPVPANPNAYMVSKAAFNMLALQGHIDFGSQIKVFAMSPRFFVSNL